MGTPPLVSPPRAAGPRPGPAPVSAAKEALLATLQFPLAGAAQDRAGYRGRSPGQQLSRAGPTAADAVSGPSPRSVASISTVPPGNVNGPWVTHWP